MNEENKDTIQPNLSLQKKSAARIAAVQCLYERLVGDEKPAPEKQLERLKTRLKDNKNEQKLTIGAVLEPNYSLVLAILNGTQEFADAIEKRVANCINKEWTLERMSPILIAILQCAVFELFFYKDGKHKIIIDEYTRLTARFFADNEVNFVHGVLQKEVLQYITSYQ